MARSIQTNTSVIDDREFEVRVVKSQNRVSVNLTILQIVVGVFTFIVAVNPTILLNNLIIAVQLVICIPLLMGSIFARKKLPYVKRAKLWSGFGYVTFTLAYSAFINVIGILLGMFASVTIALWFFVVCILIAMSCSVLEILESRKKLFWRVMKDMFYVLLLIVFGILPVLHAY